MYPVILATMEGGSDQFSGSFNGVYDDNVILNSVRSRKKVQELHNCPVCSCTIRQGELESHLILEVERLQKISCGTKRKLSSSSSSLAMPGSSSNADPVGDEVDVRGCLGSDVYERVNTNRLSRLRARRRATPPPAAPPTGECPVCAATLPTWRLQRHALRCLRRTGAAVDDDVPDDTSEEEGSIDVENDEPPEEAGGSFGAEYQWCGEWRVRASALQPRAARAPRRASCDVALVVDGDEDTELYGPPQYSPSRIAPDTEIGTEDDRCTEMDETHNPSDSPSESKDTVVSDRKSNGMVEASAETRIQALKARIQELESRAPGDARCLICLGGYSAPAASIQCWHVYCEECWLASLKAKKICPQCNAITTVHHLRRIYM